MASSDDEKAFCVEKRKLLSKIISARADCCHWITQFNQKRKLYLGITQASADFMDVLQKYHILWEKLKEIKDSDESNRLIAIEQEKCAVVIKFTQFFERITKEDQVKHHLIQKFQELNVLQDNVWGKIKGAQDVNELINLSIPTLRGAKIRPVNMTLARRWKELQLLPRIKYIYDQLRLVICPDKVFHIYEHMDNVDF